MNYILLISGKKQSGKDTLYEIIKKNTRDSFTRVAFADSLKEKSLAALNTIFGIHVSKDIFIDEKQKEAPLHLPNINKIITPRYFLQIFGTEFIRNTLDENYWVKTAWIKILKDLPKQNIVITDCRYPNEIEEIKKCAEQLGYYKVVTIRLNRKRPFFSKKEHSSETALDKYKKFDYIYNNNGSLEDLENFAKELLSHL